MKLLVVILLASMWYYCAACRSVPTMPAGEGTVHVLLRDGVSIARHEAERASSGERVQPGDIWRVVGASKYLLSSGCQGAPVVADAGEVIGLVQETLGGSNPEHFRLMPIANQVRRWAAALEATTGNAHETDEWILGPYSGEQVAFVRWWGDDAVRISGIATVGCRSGGYYVTGLPGSFWGRLPVGGPVQLGVFVVDGVGYGFANGEPVVLPGVDAQVGITRCVEGNVVLCEMGVDAPSIALVMEFYLEEQPIVRKWRISRDMHAWREWCIECVDTNLDLVSVNASDRCELEIEVDARVHGTWAVNGTYGAGWQSAVVGPLVAALESIEVIPVEIRLRIRQAESPVEDDPRLGTPMNQGH